MLYHCWWKIKDQNDEIAELKWSMSLYLQSYLDKNIAHEFLLLCRQHIIHGCQGM